MTTIWEQWTRPDVRVACQRVVEGIYTGVIVYSAVALSVLNLQVDLPADNDAPAFEFYQTITNASLYRYTTQLKRHSSIITGKLLA